MEGWLGTLAQEFGALPRVSLRLLAAALFGAVVGWQRERSGKAAGLRTHILVALGTALFVVAASEAGADSDGMSRVLQGLATGIGFIGAGAILKLESEHDIKGLTTAASLWATAAVGVAAGLGLYAVGLAGTVMVWVVLALLLRGEGDRPHRAVP